MESKWKNVHKFAIFEGNYNNKSLARNIFG